jgi:2-octaprenylphenol hydroxylase
MQKFDVLIVGAGMVGLTLALALRKQTQLKVAIADTKAITELTEEPEVRVSAINAASKQIFINLGVWSAIAESRLQPYQHMHIWDKAGYGKLEFSASDDISFSANNLVNNDLGTIIENNVIRNALWHKAQADEGITFFTDEAITNIGQGENEVFVSFSSQMPITAKLVAGADGAHSWVRNKMNMPMAFRDYDHHAIVATIACEQGHQNTAWQVFLPTGPLALLPLSSEKSSEKSTEESREESSQKPNSHLCSIVWSTSPDDAQRLLSLSPEEFAKEITAATDGKVGKISLESERYTHPLTMRLAHDFIKEQIVLVGDAAHTMHPLAGQGVNLGLLDAVALAQTLSESSRESTSIQAKQLKAFARWRKTEATEMIAVMEMIKQTFTPQQKPLQILRGLGMSLLDKISPIKNQLLKQALGHKSNLPELAKAQDELSER